MSTTHDDVAYQKLSISKLKSLLSASGVIIPHVKDQPKEYYIKLYEAHILKEQSPDDDEMDEGEEDRSESEEYTDEEADAPMQPQYINPRSQTRQEGHEINANKISNTATPRNKSVATSPPRSRRLLAVLVIPMSLAALVALGLTCGDTDAWCTSVRRVLRVLSLGLYGHNSGAADY
eukprot:TRINITY_DN2817_c0_g1_i1.p1 TRINITY_DN2817_c0_g1~~TRINITY_DN2817_c0_g1_i1.p1  ORF type:complete len:177 (-),score=16.81 TRINITY_DN2817_c0_g1_i1:6-536(-)